MHDYLTKTLLQACQNTYNDNAKPTKLKNEKTVNNKTNETIDQELQKKFRTISVQ